MRAKVREGGVGHSAEVEGEEIRGDLVEQNLAVRGGEERQERSDVEQLGDGAHGDRRSGGARSAGVVLGATTEGDGF